LLVGCHLISVPQFLKKKIFYTSNDIFHWTNRWQKKNGRKKKKKTTFIVNPIIYCPKCQLNFNAKVNKK
jgi:hypothetical protein